MISSGYRSFWSSVLSSFLHPHDSLISTSFFHIFIPSFLITRLSFLLHPLIPIFSPCCLLSLSFTQSQPLCCTSSVTMVGKGRFASDNRERRQEWYIGDHTAHSKTNEMEKLAQTKVAKNWTEKGKGKQVVAAVGAAPDYIRKVSHSLLTIELPN